MLNRTASFFSYLLHPMFVPLYGYSIILFSNNYYAYFFPLRTKLLLLAIVFTFTCLLPVLNLFVLLRLKLINSLTLEDGKQRTFPYVVTAMFYLGMAYLIWGFSIPFIFKGIIISGAVCIFSTALVNLKWKISAHMVGISGLTAAVIVFSILLHENFLPLIALLFGLSGVLAFSRLQLKSHTPAQVYTGYLLGFALTFLFLFVMYIVDLPNKI